MKYLILLSIITLTILIAHEIKNPQRKFEFPTIWVDENIKYRLHYGKKIYDFIDVRYDDCAYINGKFICEYQDDSPILNFRIGKSLSQGNYIEIFKEKSHWFLCDFDVPTQIRLEKN